MDYLLVIVNTMLLCLVLNLLRYMKHWTMQEELECFSRNEVWSLVERLKDHHINVIGTKWVFKNKQDEHGTVIQNKARLVEQGFAQLEGMYYEDTFAPVARLEAIRLLLTFASFHNFKLYQMDVKSAFLKWSPKSKCICGSTPGFRRPMLSQPCVFTP